MSLRLIKSDRKIQSIPMGRIRKEYNAKMREMLHDWQWLKEVIPSPSNDIHALIKVDIRPKDNSISFAPLHSKIKMIFWGLRSFKVFYKYKNTADKRTFFVYRNSLEVNKEESRSPNCSTAWNKSSFRFIFVFLDTFTPFWGKFIPFQINLNQLINWI